MLSVMVLGFQLYSVLSFDQDLLRSGVVVGMPARFIHHDREELDALKVRLQEFQLFPEELKQDFRRSDFGRKRLFLPDVVLDKKILGKD